MEGYSTTQEFKNTFTLSLLMNPCWSLSISQNVRDYKSSNKSLPVRPILVLINSAPSLPLFQYFDSDFRRIGLAFPMTGIYMHLVLQRIVLENWRFFIVEGMSTIIDLQHYSLNLNLMNNKIDLNLTIAWYESISRK